MADEEQLSAALQVLVLAALCFDKGHGAAIAAQVRSEHFDGVWRDFVARVLAYRKRHGKPPGKGQIKDIADQVAFGKNNSLLKNRLLPDLIAESEGLNAEYIATRVSDFVRRQTLKRAIVEASDRYAQDDDKLVPDVERIMHRALRARQQTMSAGIFLDDLDAIQFVNQHEDVISLGIPELDALQIGLIPKQLLLFLGPKGSGKTWFCCHCGVKALLQRQKVVHYSLEMHEAEVIPRYYQNLFGVAMTPDRYVRTAFELDELNRVVDIKTRSVKPKLDFRQDNIKKILKSKIKAFGSRFGGLVVKSFPTSSLTISQLAGHLDYLEEVEHFIPNVVIIDYPKLMYADRKQLRIDIGQNIEELRGLASARNFAIVAPHQGTRATIGAKRVRSSQAGEDISVVQTADTVIAISRTESEERLGLARLSIEHSRRSRSKQEILITQAYDIGQFVTSSTLMQNNYWEVLRKYGDDDGDGE